MKLLTKITLSVLLTLITLCVSPQATAQTELSSPLYLGFILVDEPTVETMAEVCDYYGLQAIPTTDGYTTYRHPDGTIFRFKQSDNRSEGMDGRLLEIQTPLSQKEINKAFTTLQYKKSGKAKVILNTEATDGTPLKTVYASTYDLGSKYARTFLRAYVTTNKPQIITFHYINSQ